MVTEFEVLYCKNAEEFEKWMETNSSKQSGIWLQFYKKNANQQSVTYMEAVDIALCYGWIDSQMKKFDEFSYLQKFTPRRAKSIWSKINTEKVERLIKDKKMRPSGLAEVQIAKNDGRWERAYDSPSNITIPEQFMRELAKNKKAEEFFKTLNKTNLYAIAWRIQTAKKDETKLKRIHAIIEMLSKNEKFHP